MFIFALFEGSVGFFQWAIPGLAAKRGGARGKEPTPALRAGKKMFTLVFQRLRRSRRAGTGGPVHGPKALPALGAECRSGQRREVGLEAVSPAARFRWLA